MLLIHGGPPVPGSMVWKSLSDQCFPASSNVGHAGDLIQPLRSTLKKSNREGGKPLYVRMWLIWYANMTYQSKASCVPEAHKGDLAVDYAFGSFS